jgi:hypothetical protein
MEFNIVKLLYTYGPFALLVFFVYVIEGKARSVLKDKSLPSSVTATIYSATWVAIFGLCGSVVYVWMVLNVTPEATIRGTFENLEAKQSVASRFNLYLRRDYDTGDKFDYGWRLVTPSRLPDGYRIDFDFASSPAAIPTRHAFLIRSSFYESPVAIRYSSKSGKLRLEHAGKTEVLRPVDDSVRNESAPAAPVFAVVPTVFAAVRPSPATLYKRLDAVDPVIRRTARDELAARGKEALPQIEEILLSERSSIRLRVGVISAINRTKGIDGDALSDAAYLAVLRAASDPDPSLADEAYKFFARFSVAGSVELPLGLGGPPATSAVIRVKAPDPRKGDFTFLIKVSRQGRVKALLELNEIQVSEDSSGGSTRWIFSFLAGQQEAFRLPNRRYTDSPAPKKYRITPADRASASIRVESGGTLSIRVIGYKPKNLPRAVVKSS